MARRPSVFVDTSALIAALLSPSGAAAAILTLHQNNLIQVVISEYVLIELERSPVMKSAAARGRYAFFLLTEPPILPLPTVRAVNRAATVISSKDAPILASAKTGRVSALVTWDKEFVQDSVQAWLGKPIFLPSEFLRWFRITF